MIKYLRLKSGRHEDLSRSLVEFWHSDGFNTPWEAMNHVAQVLWIYFISEERKECCDRFKNENDYLFCPICGRGLGATDTVAHFLYFLQKMFKDCYGQEEDWLMENGWNNYDLDVPFCFSKNESFDIPSDGEYSIIACLLSDDFDQRFKEELNLFLKNSMPFWYNKEYIHDLTLFKSDFDGGRVVV